MPETVATGMYITVGRDYCVGYSHHEMAYSDHFLNDRGNRSTIRGFIDIQKRLRELFQARDLSGQADDAL